MLQCTLHARLRTESLCGIKGRREYRVLFIWYPPFSHGAGPAHVSVWCNMGIWVLWKVVPRTLSQKNSLPCSIQTGQHTLAAHGGARKRLFLYVLSAFVLSTSSRRYLVSIGAPTIGARAVQQQMPESVSIPTLPTCWYAHPTSLAILNSLLQIAKHSLNKQSMAAPHHQVVCRQASVVALLACVKHFNKFLHQMCPSKTSV